MATGRVESRRSWNLTYLDTHVALWVCSGEVPLSPAALTALEDPDLRISPIVLLEMRFLQEIGRVKIGPDDWLAILRSDFNVTVCGLPLQQIVENSYALTWTRDPFDRAIVGQAIAGAGGLITRDKLILEHYQKAIW